MGSKRGPLVAPKPGLQTAGSVRAIDLNPFPGKERERLGAGEYQNGRHVHFSAAAHLFNSLSSLCRQIPSQGSGSVSIPTHFHPAPQSLHHDNPVVILC